MSKINEVIIKFDKINDNYIIIINDNKNTEWYKYEIICSYSLKKNQILWAEDMILIPKKIKSIIKNNIKIDNINSLEKYLISKKKIYIDIISEISDNFKIYYGLTKIIKK